MKKFLKMFGAAGMLGAMVLASGCGGGDGTYTGGPTAIVVTKAGQPITATVAAGTVTIPTAGVIATNAVGTSVLATTVANTAFTGVTTTGAVITVPPTITVNQSSNGAYGVPTPTGGTAVASSAGAIQILFDGLSKATFDAKTPVKVIIPVTGLAAGASVTVLVIKGDGTSVKVTGAVNAAGTAVEISVFEFPAWFIVNPKNASGAFPIV